MKILNKKPVVQFVSIFSPSISVRPDFFLKRAFSTHTNTMSAQHWKSEKERILNLPLQEKRKLYKVRDYVRPESVEPWSEYVHKVDVSTRKPTDDDRAEFAKMTLDPQLNKSLADKVAIYKGDITQLEVDAIVNAANARLQAGGGVDGAIHRASGPLLQEECRHVGGCETGDAVVTGGYLLPAKYVIQTVGPTDKSPSKLGSCYAKCFTLATENNIRSIAFPCISTGVYGFPNRLAAHVALSSARKALEQDERSARALEKVVFCTFMPVDVEIYEAVMQLYFPVE